MSKISLETLGRSSIVAGISELWRISSRFVITPIILATLGWSGLGAWTLVFSVAAYVSMANASMGLAYIKLTAECVHHGQFDRLGRVLGSGMTGIGSVAVVGLFAAWWFGESIMAGLNVPAELVPDAAIALCIIMGVLVLRMTMGCCNEVLAGLQRIDLTYRLQIYASIIEFCLAVPLLWAGHGLIGLAFAHAMGQITANLAAWGLVRRLLPQLRVSPALVSREGFALVFSVGGRFQALSFINTFVAHGIKFLISVMFSVRWVAVYDLAEKLINLGQAASAAVVAPLMPAFADIQAGGDKARERELFYAGSKADALIGGGSFLFLALLAGPALLLWTGEHTPESAFTLQMVAIGEGTFILTSVVSSNLRAQGRVGLELRVALLTASLLGLAMVPLVPILGYHGLVLSRMIAQTLGATWYLRRYFRSQDIAWREYFRHTRIMHLLMIYAAIGGTIAVGRWLLPIGELSGLRPRFGAMLEVAVWGVPYVLVLGFSVWRVYLTPSERERLSGIATKIRSKLLPRRA